MIFKIKDQKIKIKRNKFNSFWNFKNNYLNSTFIEIDNYWYNCYIEFFEFENNKFINIWHPSIVDKKTCIVKQILVKGVYVELKISKFQYFLLTFLIGKNEINYKTNTLKKKIYEIDLKVKISLLLSVIYLLLKHYDNNSIINLIFNNIIVETFSTFSLLYFLFSLFQKNKKINKKYIEEEYYKLKEQDKLYKKIKKTASL